MSDTQHRTSTLISPRTNFNLRGDLADRICASPSVRRDRADGLLQLPRTGYFLASSDFELIMKLQPYDHLVGSSYGLYLNGKEEVGTALLARPA